MHTTFDEVIQALRRRGDDLSKEAADSLAYLWSQDRLLSKTQNRVEELTYQLAETKRPLDAQMARLNQNVLDLNEACDKAQDELNCAEEWLDHYAAQLDLEQTHFDCIGDYIVAVVEAALKKVPQATRDEALPILEQLQSYVDGKSQPGERWPRYAVQQLTNLIGA